MGDDKNIRHRFTVPKDDKQVEDWIQAQSNLGFSLRVLIRAFVRSYGYRDATCMELGVPVKRVGRPPKHAQIALGQMMEQEEAPLFPTEEQVEEPAPVLPKSEPKKQEAEAASPPPGRMSFGGQASSGNSIESMLGIPQPTRSQQSLMDGIMNMDQ